MATATPAHARPPVIRTRPACPRCGPGAEVYRLRDALGRAIRTRPRVYCCRNCASAFAAR